MSTAAQVAANQANAQFSTGPVTEEGKAASARNNFRHGLASGQLIVPGEDPLEFDALAEGLFNEHQPATTTEENLVFCMAQHFWLGQRAIRLQNEAFIAGQGVSQLSLLLRYQSTNQRAYSRCLADLFKLRTERQNGFERQKKIDAENRPPKPKQPYYIRNPKYAHLLLVDVPKEERFIKIDPNAPEVRAGEPSAPEIGFESKSNSQDRQDAAAPLSELNASSNGFESQIDPRAKKLLREIREMRLRLDKEEAA
jgi:hypothetical protein